MTLWQKLLPNPTQGLCQQQELTLLTMCIWGEARRSSGEIQRAVGFVVRNRVERRLPRFGLGWREVLLKPYQFSTFDPEGPSRERIFHPLQNDSEWAWKSCCAGALIAYEELYSDASRDALFYYSGTSRPVWAAQMRETLRLHDFVFMTDEK